MNHYRITGWQDDQPHWHIAIVESETPEAAMDDLEAWLKAFDDDRLPDTIGATTPRSKWMATPIEGPVLLALGNYCR